MSTPARFITFEGIDGVGKSTQIALLSQRLDQQGIPHIVTREPGGCPLGEWVRTLLKSEDCNIGAYAEALLFAAARLEHAQKTIAPALNKGIWVLSDRYLDSSMAYQGSLDAELKSYIQRIHADMPNLCLPHRTVLLLLESREINRRSQQKTHDRFENHYDFHTILGIYQQLAEKEPKRFCIVDTSGTQSEVSERIWLGLQPL